MILFRYLGRQVLQVMLAVSLILLVAALSSRFIQYLGQAVAGELASDVLLLLILYRLPDFLLVITPLALFLGILLAYGRMYAENEMIVLLGSGIEPRRLLALTSGVGAGALLAVALLSLWLAPWGVRNTELLKQSQERLTEVDLIVAGQFQHFGGGGRITHAERVSRDGERRRLENVFVATAARQTADGWVAAPGILLAESAGPRIDPDTGARFMRLDTVLQYEGVPGSREFTVGRFREQFIRLPDPVPIEQTLLDEAKALPTGELLRAVGAGSLSATGSSSAAGAGLQAELQWRLSMPLLVPVIILIAVPLSRVAPRQGRYSKLVPAGLLYAVYFVLLQVSRDLLSEGALHPALGLWWVHLLFIVLGIALHRHPTLGDHLALGDRPGGKG